MCFNVSGTRLSLEIRSALFKSLLRQEAGWYDREENSTPSLSTKLAVDSGRIQGVGIGLGKVTLCVYDSRFLPFQLVGIRIGSLLESGVALLVSVGIAFGYSWLTALVILGFMPFMLLASLLHFSLAGGTANQTQESQASIEVRLPWQRIIASGGF